jgi:hypothetical protein
MASVTRSPAFIAAKKFSDSMSFLNAMLRPLIAVITLCGRTPAFAAGLPGGTSRTNDQTTGFCAVPEELYVYPNPSHPGRRAGVAAVNTPRIVS